MEITLGIKYLTGLRNKLFAPPIVRDTVTTTLWSILGKAVGFLVPFFIAAWFGVTSETDAFFFGYSLIMLLVTIFSPVAESIVVPFIAEVRTKGDDVGKFVGRVLGISALGFLCLFIPFLLFIKPALFFLAKFPPAGLHLVYQITLESSPLIILLVWTSILAGTLNAYKIFGIPAISPAFRAVVTLAFIFVLKERLGVHAIALGYVIGEIFRLAILFALIKRLNIFKLKISFKWEIEIAKFFKTSSYQVIGMIIIACTPVINKTIASWLGSGKVSLLEYAERLYLIPQNLLGTGLIVTLLSYWSERYYKDGEKRLKRDVWKAIKVVSVFSVVLTSLFLLIKNNLVSIVYGHGKFPKEQISNVQTILGFYLLGLTPYFLKQVYVKAFLTRKDTKSLLLIAILGTLANIVFNIIFIRTHGIAGIAMANSAVAFLTFGIAAIIFYWRKT